MKVTVKKYEPLPENVYRLMPISADLRNSNNPAYPGDFISWDCEVLDEPEFEGRTVSFAMSLSFGPTSKAYKFMRALGLSDETDANIDFDTDDYLNIPFYAKLTIHVNDKGVASNKFDTIWSEAEYAAMISKHVHNVAPPAASGVRPPAARTAASGVRTPAATPGVRTPAASGVRTPAASGVRTPAATPGVRPPAARTAASGARPPAAIPPPPVQEEYYEEVSSDDYVPDPADPSVDFPE